MTSSFFADIACARNLLDRAFSSLYHDDFPLPLPISFYDDLSFIVSILALLCELLEVKVLQAKVGELVFDRVLNLFPPRVRHD